MSEGEPNGPEEERKISIRWADWELENGASKSDAGPPDGSSSQDKTCDRETPRKNTQIPTLPLQTAQVKLDALLDKSRATILPSPEPEPPEQPELPDDRDDQEHWDTLEAHKQIQFEFWKKTNPKQFAEMTTVVTRQNSGWENPFRPEGDLSKEADEIVDAWKGGKLDGLTPTSSPVPPAEVDGHVVEGRFGQKETQVNNTAVKVEHGVILSSKTEAVEHVVIPEKKGGCCIIL